MPGGVSPLQFRRLEPSDKVTYLSFGNEAFAPLKSFLRREAKSFDDQNLARTYAYVDGDCRVVAYITLVGGEVALEFDELTPGTFYRYPTYPAVKIARLGVDRRLQGQSLGRKMVSFALALSKLEICPLIGCRFMVVDAKRESIAFYDRCGFTIIDTTENRTRAAPVMFVDLHKLAVDQ